LASAEREAATGRLSYNRYSRKKTPQVGVFLFAHHAMGYRRPRHSMGVI